MSKTRNFFWPAAQSSQLLEFVAREKNFSGIYINLLTFLGARPDARTDAQTHGQTHRQTHGQTHRRTPAYACMFARTDAQTHVQTPWTRGTRARGSHRGCDGTVRAHGSREGTAALRQDRTRRTSARGRGHVGGEAREWDGLDRDNMSPQKSKLGKRDGCTASREARIFVRVPES